MTSSATSSALRPSARIFVAGHAGLVGSALVRRLRAMGASDLLLVLRSELDLRDQRAVERWFDRHRPELVFLVAGTVGGISANSSRPGEFLYDNLLIQASVIEAARKSGVRKLLALGSSCIYPREAEQPMREEALLTGPLEPTNEWYALAKIAGIKLCQAYRRQYDCNFISAMPTNVYGPRDNFDPESSHVLPALIRKFHEAKLSDQGGVTVWGSGRPRREFLHVDDLAAACVFLMERYEGDGHINVGTGVDQSIGELAETVRDVIAPEIEIELDSTKPDGPPRKLLDVSRLHALGWRHRIELTDGIRSTYAWLLEALERSDVRGWSVPVEGKVS